MDQYIGKWLDERYEILDVLGVGGMSVVYKAKCHRLNRLVAVKILKEELAEDEEIRNRFHDESQAVAMMSHPNIVNVYDVNQSEGVEYIVMELIDGITLKQYMKRRGEALNWREALHFSTQIFQALKHAHSRGIIHRDIKPQNIMVLRDGSVKVADFGIARISDSQRTLTTETLGSVHYISPEQAKGSNVDGRSDLYSAGVVMYEMLTGRLPYEGDSAIGVALQHINSIPLSPRELKEDIPAGMEQIAMKCMAPNRNLRYSDADEVLSDLDAFRKNPEIVFPYENPWIPGGDDATVIARQPLVESGAGEGEPDGPQATGEEGKQEQVQAQDPNKGKRRAIILGTVAVLLIVIVLLFVLVWKTLVSGLLDSGETYQTPDLLGMTRVEAETYLLENEAYTGHFTISVSEETRYDVNYEPGQIIEQTPKGGTTTKSEVTEIVVTLCGEEPVEEEVRMPDILGKDYKEWAERLEVEYDVIVKYDARNSDDYEEGRIIKTDPEAGEVLSKGQTVMLYYSKGPAVKTVPMILVEGMTLEEATKALTELGLSVGKTDTVDSDEEAGVVVYQGVPVGSDVYPGTAVNLQISGGPKQPDEEGEITTQPVDDPNSNNNEGGGNGDNGNNGGSGNNGDNGNNGGNGGSGNNGADETHQVTVNLPEGRTEDVYVTIKVNGQQIQGSPVVAKPEDGKLKLTVSGSVEGLTVALDGEDYTDFTVE